MLWKQKQINKSFVCRKLLPSNFGRRTVLSEAMWLGPLHVARGRSQPVLQDYGQQTHRADHHLCQVLHQHGGAGALGGGGQGRGEYFSKNFYFCTTPKNGFAQESRYAWYPDCNIFARIQNSSFLARLKALFLHDS